MLCCPSRSRLAVLSPVGFGSFRRAGNGCPLRADSRSRTVVVACLGIFLGAYFDYIGGLGIDMIVCRGDDQVFRHGLVLNAGLKLDGILVTAESSGGIPFPNLARLRLVILVVAVVAIPVAAAVVERARFLLVGGITVVTLLSAAFLNLLWWFKARNAVSNGV